MSLSDLIQTSTTDSRVDPVMLEPIVTADTVSPPPEKSQYRVAIIWTGAVVASVALAMAAWYWLSWGKSHPRPLPISSLTGLRLPMPPRGVAS